MNKAFKYPIDVWENLYSQGQSILKYPDSSLVSLTHHVLNPQKRHKVLDYSFGTGANLIFLLKHGFDVSGVEVSKSAVNIVRTRLKTERLNAELKLFEIGKVPYKDNAFDVVLAWNVLYYNDWKNLAVAIKEIDRVLKPGGLFIGTMAAIGGGFYRQAIPLANGHFKLKMGSQKDLEIIIVTKKDLQKCFPGKRISIGKTGFSYQNLDSMHWIVTYEKE